jgi:hypothetical protein
MSLTGSTTTSSVQSTDALLPVRILVSPFNDEQNQPGDRVELTAWTL